MLKKKIRMSSNIAQILLKKQNKTKQKTNKKKQRNKQTKKRNQRQCVNVKKNIRIDYY